MKAHRASLNDTVLGLVGVAAGVIVLVVTRDHRHELEGFALGLLGFMAAMAAVTFGLAMRQLRRPAALPATATVLPGVGTAVRVVLWGMVPFVPVVFNAVSSPDRVTWVLGPGCVLLGLSTCAAAALIARAERRRGIRLFRVTNRFALFVTR